MNHDTAAPEDAPETEEESADALWAQFDEEEGTAPSDPVADAENDGFTVEEDEPAAEELAGEDVPDDGDAAAAEPAAAEAGGGDVPATDEPALDWSTVPESHRAAFEQLTAANAKLLQKERSASGRAGAFQRRYEDLVKAAQPRSEEGSLPSSAAALASLKDDYPEFATPLEQALTAMEGRVNTLTDAEEGRRVAAQAELDEYLKQQETDLLSQHSDYIHVLTKNGPLLVAWIDDQPRAVRDAFDRNAEKIVNAAEAATVISAFKAHLGMGTAAPAAAPAAAPKLDARRTRQLTASTAPDRSSRRPTVSGIPEEGDPQDIWDAFDAAENR